MPLLFFYCLAWVISFIMMIKKKTDTRIKRISSLLRCQLFFAVGCGFLFNFVGHVFMSESVAASIGWISNGFQIELGFVSLGIGISGLLSVFFNDEFWISTTIPVSTFLFGAALMHIKELLQLYNYNVGNIIPILPDILIPMTIIILLIMKKRISYSMA